MARDRYGNLTGNGWPPELAEAEVKLAELEKGNTQTIAFRTVPLDDTDTERALAPAAPLWTVEKPKYLTGEFVSHEDKYYRVIQDVVPLEHQPPGGEGMLAVYRPIDTEHSGDIDNPIVFEYGMDVDNGKYYTYKGKLYLAKADMKPCTWPPGTPGLWQWELVN